MRRHRSLPDVAFECGLGDFEPPRAPRPSRADATRPRGRSATARGSASSRCPRRSYTSGTSQSPTSQLRRAIEAGLVGLQSRRRASRPARTGSVPAGHAGAAPPAACRPMHPACHRPVLLRHHVGVACLVVGAACARSSSGSLRSFSLVLFGDMRRNHSQRREELSLRGPAVSRTTGAGEGSESHEQPSRSVFVQ